MYRRTTSATCHFPIVNVGRRGPSVLSLEETPVAGLALRPQIVKFMRKGPCRGDCRVIP